MNKSNAFVFGAATILLCSLKQSITLFFLKKEKKRKEKKALLINDGVEKLLKL
jgi:hypothetical protein